MYTLLWQVTGLGNRMPETDGVQREHTIQNGTAVNLEGMGETGNGSMDSGNFDGRPAVVLYLDGH